MTRVNFDYSMGERVRVRGKMSPVTKHLRKWDGCGEGMVQEGVAREGVDNLKKDKDLWITRKKNDPYRFTQWVPRICARCGQEYRVDCRKPEKEQLCKNCLDK